MPLGNEKLIVLLGGTLVTESTSLMGQAMEN